MTIAVVAASVLAAPVRVGSAAEPSSSAPVASRAKVLVMPVVFDGIDDAQRQTLLEQRLRVGLARASFAVVEAPASESCTDAACWRRVAVEADARYLVTTRITAADRVYRLDLGLVDGLDGRTIVTASETCDVCGINDSADLLADLSASLGVKARDLALEPPRIEVDTRPAGAAALLDGQTIGRTPLERVVTPGRHRVRLELRGYVPAERSIVAVAGTRERVLVDLRPVTVAAPARDDRRRLRIAGWSTFTGSLVLLGTGASLLALDGREARTRCSGPDLDVFGHCRYLHESTIAGAVTTAVGLAALGAAIGLLVAARQRRVNARSRP